MKQALALLVAAVLCAAIANALAGKERKLAWVGEYPNALQLPAARAAIEQKQAVPAPKEPVHPPSAAAQQQPAPSTAGASQAVNGDQAWNLYLQHALFLDARRSEEYAAGHIAGAHSFAVWEGDIDQKLGALGVPPDSLIVTYCSGGACEDSTILAEKLKQLGYTNVHVYAGGFPEWKGQGRPVEEGPGT